MEKSKPYPPKRFLRFFRGYCHPRLADDIEGDLIEVYRKRARKNGKRNADIRFIIDVILLFRPGIIRPAEGSMNLNNYGMYKSYLKVGWRNLLKNKVYSIINVTGLAIGLAVGFLIYQYVQVELSYDRFHANADRLYRLPISYSGSFSSLRPSATTHPAMGPMLKADLPEVQDFARLVRASLFIPAATVSYTKGDGVPVIFNEESVYLADPSFLTMFSFPLTTGDANTALIEPRSIVITERIAEKYFGADNALGKILELNEQDFKVTGVLNNVPVNSHLQFDILLSFSTLGSDTWGYDNWLWPEFYNYILLAPETDPTAIEAKLPGFLKKYLAKIWEEHKFKSSSYLQPIADIHLKSDLNFEQDINGSERTVYFLTLLSLFVLVIAWINYVNLSTAKALERSKEVGLRKVSGATKRQLITQFFFDALLVNVLAVLFAGILLIVGIPYFESVVGKDISGVLKTSGTWYSFSFWGIVLAALSSGILIVGIYPALLLSNFNPALVLKGKFYKSRSGIVLRKGLVVFQYVLSIFLIAGTITIFRQLNFMQKANLGYNKEQVLVLRSAAIYDSTYSSQIAYFKNELLQLPAVEQVTATGEIPGRAIAGRNTIRKAADDPQNGLITYQFSVDDQTISTFEMSMAAGRNLGENDKFIFYSRNEDKLTSDGYYIGGGQNKIMINEYLASQLGFQNPQDAVGQNIKIRLGQEYPAEIVGVVRNHHQVSLKENYESIAYYYPYEGWCSFFSVRINPAGLTENINAIKDIYTAAFPGNAFEYFFLDDHFNNQYKSDQQFGTIFGIFTALAILIGCLGLFGLGVFEITQRTKEIGIRKVLGASARSILILFSKDSALLVIISYIISIPLIYTGTLSWLDNFAFHIGLGWQMFVVPPLLLLAISVASITFVSLRAALMNPVISLRQE
jgi:putative ABC transport system permease protein